MAAIAIRKIANAFDPTSSAIPVCGLPNEACVISVTNSGADVITAIKAPPKKESLILVLAEITPKFWTNFDEK